MSIINRIGAYLDNRRIHYQIVEHPPTHNSLSSAISANIAPEQVVKGVIVEDHQGNKLMAILPASHKISLTTLNAKLHRQFHLLKEAAIYELFTDCDPGAIPPFAEVYHMDRVYDEDLMQQAELYLEAGDHHSFIKLTRIEFGQLMRGARPLHFSHRVFH